MLAGKQTHTVPTMPKTADTIIINQSKAFSFVLISLPKILRWNANGSIIQIEKQKTEPIRDIIVSKEGIRIATNKMITVRTPRTALRSSPRPYLDNSARRGGEATLRTSRPSSLSAELMIGRVLGEMSAKDCLRLMLISLQWNLCDWYDSNENHHTYRESS